MGGQARDLRAGRADSGITRGERALAWLVTGPVGRLVAFVLDLTAALVDAARRRIRGS